MVAQKKKKGGLRLRPNLIKRMEFLEVGDDQRLDKRSFAALLRDLFFFFFALFKNRRKKICFTVHENVFLNSSFCYTELIINFKLINRIEKKNFLIHFSYISK